jgi:hypothetical protein
MIKQSLFGMALAWLRLLLLRKREPRRRPEADDRGPKAATPQQRPEPVVRPRAETGGVSGC